MVEAVAAGKQAARSIRRFFQGEPLEQKVRVPVPRQRLEPLELPDEEKARLTRPAMPGGPGFEPAAEFYGRRIRTQPNPGPGSRQTLFAL